MRETLFRGKRIDNGEWVYGYYARKGADKESFHHYICVSTFSSDYQSNYTYPFYLYDYEVDPLTVGQCVPGLADKNDKKIFEGDCFRTYCIGLPVYKHIVGYYHERFAFMARCIEMNTVHYLSDYRPSAIEVIGNIHDNPELLEDKQ